MDYNKYYKKTKIERDHNIDNKESSSIDIIIYSLLITMLILIPIFIKAHIGEFISPKLTFISTSVQADIFSYYKYIFLIIVTVLIGILFIYKVMFLQHNISKSRVNLFLGIFVVAVTLSAIVSPYKSLALHGMYNRHEGTITMICYLALFFVAANMKFTSKQISGLLYALYPFVVINMVLSLAVFNEQNLLEVGWINNFILGSIPEGAQVSETAKLWGTVSNPNYISGIGAVLAVLFLTWAAFDENKLRTSINVLMAIVSFSMVLTSLSTSGFLTFIALLPFILLLVFFSKQKMKSLLVLVIFFLMATSILIPYANKNPRVWDETIGFLIKKNPFAEQQQVSLMNIDDDIIKDGLNEIFLPSRAFAEEIDSNVKFTIPSLPEPGQGAGTGRVYNWEKTLELVKERPLFGYGLDTFPYFFPQNDPDKIANLGSSEIIIDKPHNFFINIIYGTGILSFVSFIMLIVLIIVKQIQIFIKSRKLSNGSEVSICMFLSCIAYLVQGLFNDSIIGTAPIFWIFLGVVVSNIDELQKINE